MVRVQIIKATSDDLAIVQSLGRQTFLDAFAKDNAEEDILAYVNEAFSLVQMAKELDNPNSEFYLMMEHDTPVGYLKVNHDDAQTELRDLQAVEVQRIYVVEEHQGKKLGHLLFKKAVEVAKKKKASCLWLGVWEKNINAIRFYRKNGFEVFDKHSFMLGKDLQTDILMRLDLA